MKQKFASALSLALIMAMLFTSIGLADNVENDVVTGVGSITLQAGVSSSYADVLFWIQPTGQGSDGDQACNFDSASESLTFTIGTPSGVTASPSSLTFNKCKDGNVTNGQTVRFSASDSAVPGSSSFIQTANSSGGTFDYTQADFPIYVTTPPPPANTNPTVTVTGVTDGASYEFGLVPSATCSVVDAEDGDLSFAATLSTITGPLAAYGLGSQTASCSYTDAGGLNDTDSATYSIVDTAAPIISFVSRTPANGNSWNNGDVTVNWSCTDSGSGVVSATVSQTVSTAGANQSATGTCQDNAGNTASDTQTGISIDKTAPTITGSRSPAANGYGWNKDDVNVTFTCGDSLSGLDSCVPTSQLFSSEAADQSVTGTATDKAGNTATATVSSINIDKTKPTISAAATTVPNDAGWYNSNVTVHFTCADAGSGVPDGACPADQTLETEGDTVASTAMTVTDKAGNVSDLSNIVSVKIDKTEPTISAAATTIPNDAGWYNSNVTVHFTCADAGSGVPDGACPADQTLSTEGATISSSAMTVTDAAGNTSDSSNVVTVKIDKTAPTISGSASPAPNGAGWNNTNVKVSFTCGDVLSGIASCTPDVTLSNDGVGQSAGGTAVDQAGNSASATVSGINIDKTAPSVSLVGGPADGGTYYFGFLPAAPTCSSSDTLSGLDGACSMDGYSAALGSHTVTASATDKAGNSAFASATYTVSAWTLSGFFQPVDMDKVNTVKGGSTVPLKFEVFAGPTELTTTWVVKSFVQTRIACDTSAVLDEIEVTTTGGTSLRYDSVAGQFVQNWQTPKQAGACYRVTMTTQDGSSLVALFKLK